MLPRLVPRLVSRHVRHVPRLLPRHVRHTTLASAHVPTQPLFNYTSGRWVFNDTLRHTERHRLFNIDGLCRLAAHAVAHSPADILSFAKLAEGGFNRSFLISFRGDFHIVARIPYPATAPKHYALASEAATMHFLRSIGLPVPTVYAYAPTPHNPACTEYILMEFIPGTKLSDVWPDLHPSHIVSILRQLAQLEYQMMSVSFPAGGSIYYPRDLPATHSVPLSDPRFCIGPDTRLHMWHGRRSLLDVHRGPYLNPEAALLAAAHKELAYLTAFGRPLLPFRRERRDAYKYTAQPPSDHIHNLQRYMHIAPFIVPHDPFLARFCIRHPDLHPSNIIVHRSPDSGGWKVASLLDWQHASVLPLFLLAGVPQRLQNHNDPVSQSMTLPVLPDDLDELDAPEQAAAKQLYHARLVHYHYIAHTAAHNKPHFDALSDPMCVLRSRLFHHAGNPWEGETFELKIALIQAVERWEALAARGGDAPPCPIVFDEEDVRATVLLDDVQAKADRVFEVCQDVLGVGPEGWVPTREYERAVARCKLMKEEGLRDAATEEDRAEIMEHWPWDDMDERAYL